MSIYSQETSDFVKNLTHDELVEITISSLCRILQSDSLLNDLPTDITLEEVESRIAVEHGKSISLTLLRDDEAPLQIIIPQTSTVSSLKKSIQKHFTAHQNRSVLDKDIKISWKYIWRTYDLSHKGISLTTDNRLISDFGILNKSVLSFTKKKTKTPKHTLN